jgi:hypothetical protein
MVCAGTILCVRRYSAACFTAVVKASLDLSHRLLYAQVLVITVAITVFKSSLLYRAACCFNLFFIVPTHALHCTLKFWTVTLKHFRFATTCFGLPWNHIQWVHGRTLLGYWIGMLIYICCKECRCVAVCQFIPSVCVCLFVFVCVCVCGYLSVDQIGTHTHTHTHSHTHTHTHTPTHTHHTHTHTHTHHTPTQTHTHTHTHRHTTHAHPHI